ncbi:replication protein [Salmonella enterica subsp. enterica serovar Heidelberg]|nr:replication protein [Salmonella enterica subsp. enterica serovar Heidelberg]
MSGRKFGRLPNWWARSSWLVNNVRSNEIGGGIASMKCLLALSVLIDFHSRTASVSFTGMERLTGLSRPMIVKGVAKLEKDGLIKIDREMFVNSYELTVQPNDDRWAKVPVDTIRKKLNTISNRGMAPFVALKLYLTIISLRYQSNNTVKVTHETLRSYTGVQPNQIRFGLDVLYCSRLIHLQPKEDRESNLYEIIGL